MNIIREDNYKFRTIIIKCSDFCVEIRNLYYAIYQYVLNILIM